MNTKKIKVPNYGKKFNNWKFIKISESKKWPYCIFECVCFNTKEINIYSILNGIPISCGCIKKTGNKSNAWSGYGEITGTYWCNLGLGAKSMNRNFNITIKDAWNLFLKQNKKCAISGVILDFNSKSDLYKPSLDRINNNVEYEVNNIQWVSKRINFMKWKYDQNEFIFLCKEIAKFNKNVR